MTKSQTNKKKLRINLIKTIKEQLNEKKKGIGRLKLTTGFQFQIENFFDMTLLKSNQKILSYCKDIHDNLDQFYMNFMSCKL